MNEKDHLIPACVIGQFTDCKDEKSWREQEVYKVDMNTENRQSQCVMAKDIGWARGEYNSDFSIDVYGNESGLDQNDNSRDVIALDKDFQAVESKLPKFIEKLENEEGVSDSDYTNILILLSFLFDLKWLVIILQKVLTKNLRCQGIRGVIYQLKIYRRIFL